MERTRIKSDGKIGIGTTPLYKFHSVTSVGSDRAGYFENTYSGTTDGHGVWGRSINADYYGYGGFFEGGYCGAKGIVNPTGGNSYVGLYGDVDGGSGLNFGIYGHASSSGNSYAVMGSASGTGTNYGIYGTASGGSANWAGYFAGNVGLGGTAIASELRFYEPSGSGTNYTAFKAQAQAGNVTYTLPSADGSSGQFLTTNGSGTLSWVNASSAAWSLLGNAGTTAGTNFVGTTDNVDLVIKRNGTEQLRFQNNDIRIPSGVQVHNTGTTINEVIGLTNDYGLGLSLANKNNGGSGSVAIQAQITSYGFSYGTAGHFFYGSRINPPAGSYGIVINNTSANGVGARVDATGSGTTMTGLYVNASGATNNYALLVNNGNVGIGTTSPSNKFRCVTPTSTDIAGYFENTYSGSTDGYGIYGKSINADFYGFGGYFEGGYAGVFGKVTPTGSSDYFGVWGQVAGGTGNNYSVYGNAQGTGTNYAVFGTASGASSANYGVYASATGGSTTNCGVYGTASGGSTNWAGFFSGNVNVTGTLSKGAGSFLIDHPLDPLNKTLRHNFVESPENLCLYRGKIKLDASGKATVQMPSYFVALTKENEATVNLTSVGQPFLCGFDWNSGYSSFVVYGEANREVCYTVYADRDDPVIHQLYRPVEENKGNGNFEKGKLLYPKAYGYREDMGISYDKLKESKKINNNETVK